MIESSFFHFASLSFSLIVLSIVIPWLHGYNLIQAFKDPEKLFFCLFVSCSTILGCIAPLGMESGALADAQITASSVLDTSTTPGQARLHLKAVANKAGGWSALKNDLNQWLQVDLGSYTKVTRVATQGRNGHDQWVTKYRLQYSNDGVSFQVYKEPGASLAKVTSCYFQFGFIMQDKM